MKNTLDITNILYNLININAIKSKISGDVYKDQLPVGSDKVDIVCKSTTIDGDGIQKGVGYVNIHCPGEMPNHSKFTEITNLVTAALDLQYSKNTYSLLVTNVEGPLNNDPENSWFMSVRVRIRMY